MAGGIVTVRVVERMAVAAPQEAVWAAVVDWERQGRWMLWTSVTVEPGRRGLGERFTARTALGPLGFDDPMQVTRWDPPHRADVAHHGSVVRGTGSFVVTPAPGGSWLTWVEDLELPGGALGRAGFTLLEPLVRAGLRLSLRRAARAIEREGHQGSPASPEA
jgi:carbon monoxide dehydrogenase subunit G